MGNEDSKARKNQIVIGVDFGSCGITFAYGFLDDPKKEINPGRFTEQGINNKVSTEIILSEDLSEVICFGNECQTKLHSTDNRKFLHFKNVKMNLYKRKYKIKANNSNEEVDIEKIITIILKEVKKKAMEQIKCRLPKLKEKNIHWVITVPAIWDIKSKQIMINSAQNAGLIRKDDDPSNFFALEPEAASIYYHNSRHAIENGDIDMGKPFILCDLGSGTVDIVTQKKVQRDNETKFEELYPPVGGDYGCNKINEYIIDRVFKVLLGEELFNKAKDDICKINYNDWYIFENNIETFKKCFTKKEQLGQYCKIDCDVFSDYCEEEKFKELINNFNNKHPSWKLVIVKGWKINFPYQIINDLMSQLIDKIINKYIVPISESVNDIKTLIFTGGASSNPILFKMIQRIKTLNLNYVQSPNPEVAIAYGSVLYSYDHFIISPRKAKFTFGIKASEVWNDEIHKNGGKKVKDEKNKIEKCINCFTKFITKNDNLRPDQEKSHKFIMNNSNVAIQLYKTDRENATFTDEKDEKGNLIIQKFGHFNIDVGDQYDNNNREVEIKMKLGGTFISLSAIYQKTGHNFTCLYED